MVLDRVFFERSIFDTFLLLLVLDRAFFRRAIFDRNLSDLYYDSGMAIIDQFLKEKLRRKLEASLLEFSKFVFREIYGIEFIENFHHGIICNELEGVFDGRLKEEVLLFNCPPRYTKTELVVICFSAWSYLKRPNCNFIYTSHSNVLTRGKSEIIRNILMHPKVIELWGREVVDKGSMAKEHWRTLRGGDFVSVVMGGAVTGQGAGIFGSQGFGGAILIDDPNKIKETMSYKAYRTQVNESLFSRTLLSRRNDAERTPIILIMQRIHEDDLTGYILARDFSVRHVVFQGLKTDKFGHENDPRAEGDALWVSKNNIESLERMKSNDPIYFASQFAQTPSPAEGNIIQRTWIQFYNKANLPTEGRVFISCDLNFKEEGKSMVVLAVYLVSDPYVYLIKEVRGRFDFYESLERLLGLLREFPNYFQVLIEGKANGPALISMLRKKGVAKIKSIEPEGSKVYRLSLCSSRYASGEVLYPENEPWVDDRIEEIIVFPNGKHDDRVDTESQLLNYLEKFKKAVYYGSG